MIFDSVRSFIENGKEQDPVNWEPANRNESSGGFFNEIFQEGRKLTKSDRWSSLPPPRDNRNSFPNLDTQKGVPYAPLMDKNFRIERGFPFTWNDAQIKEDIEVQFKQALEDYKQGMEFLNQGTRMLIPKSSREQFVIICDNQKYDFLGQSAYNLINAETQIKQTLGRVDVEIQKTRTDADMDSTAVEKRLKLLQDAVQKSKSILPKVTNELKRIDGPFEIKKIFDDISERSKNYDPYLQRKMDLYYRSLQEQMHKDRRSPYLPKLARDVALGYLVLAKRETEQNRPERAKHFLHAAGYGLNSAAILDPQNPNLQAIHTIFQSQLKMSRQK